MSSDLSDLVLSPFFANASLASGNALAQALIGATQTYQTIQTGSSSSGADLSGIGSLIGAFSGL